MKIEISKKDKIMAGLDIPVEFRYTRDKYEIFSDNKPKIKFIDHCLKYRLTFLEIGELLGVTKQRIYTLHRYGVNKLTPSEKKEIKERDKNKCRICNNENGLHVHHTKNSRSNKKNNLVTLCGSCHRKIESIYKKPKKKLSTEVFVDKSK